MPIVTSVFTHVTTTAGSMPAASPPQPPAAVTGQLHTELAAVNLPVAGDEVGATPQFGEATAAQVKAFQQRFNLTADGNLTPETGGILSLAALVASETDPAALRTKLQAAAGAVPGSEQYNYWLARYALMARDHSLAASVRPDLFNDLHGVDLRGVFTTGQGNATPKNPEVPFPENYYSYRNSLMAQEDIDDLRKQAAPQGVGTTQAEVQRSQKLIDSALAWLNAVEAWQFGNSEFAAQRYASAVGAYDQCQDYILDYFSAYPDYSAQFTAGALEARVGELAAFLLEKRVIGTTAFLHTGILNPTYLSAQIQWRNSLLSLTELNQFDWQTIGPGNTVYQLLLGNLAGSDQPKNAFIGPEQRQILIDTHFLVIAAILAPLARGEANRLCRQYAAALKDFARVVPAYRPVLNPLSLPYAQMLRCKFIEEPFVRLLMMETMLDQAEAQYKSRQSVDDETDAATKASELVQLAALTQEFDTRQVSGDAAGNAAAPFQHLVAALTYAAVFDAVGSYGDYVANTKQALDALHASVKATVASGDVSSMKFRTLGRTVTIPNIGPSGDGPPGASGSAYPHESYLQFNLPAGQAPINPRVYGLLLQAQSRLLQIWSGFNYLGYRDDYVPPWRFSYLLDRARYFCEHAKNAQRDYLNFLNNEENEELKEMSASQNVELEKANVQIESAQVDQATDQVEASKQSAELAQESTNDAQAKLKDYQDFDTDMDELDGVSYAAGAFSVAQGIVEITTGAGVFQGISDIFGGVTQASNTRKEERQRDLETNNLERANEEAQQAQLVATAQHTVANDALTVAGLQYQASLLRHEFALQNLQFMRGQTMNTEQWYRLAGAIRSVGDTYLRYAIRMSFLAQQSYNFEADKRLSVIRFDYDLSDVGSMLAADFLLRDLDTLEQDQIAGQQTRLQQVRYVLSLAREFPQTLQSLADDGEVTFAVRLEQLERRFPGLVNLRISNVDVQPVALMDPTRVSVELTQLGFGMVRLKSQPGASPLNGNDLSADGDWLTDDAVDWPVKVHISGPETELFSGLTRQDAASASLITANERAAFEGLPGASSWRIDMSMAENQVVPGTLADVIVTFTLSGYYDSALKDAVTAAASLRRPFATTSIVSARRTLPDSYYSLVHYGTLDWPISERMLTLAGTPNQLRNIAVMLAPATDGFELGRCYCRYSIRIDLSPGAVHVLTALPQFTMTPAGLVLSCVAAAPPGTDMTWDFGDDTALATGGTVQHTYARPGRYEVLARLATGGTLVEYRSAVIVSAVHPMTAPLIVCPVLSAGALAADGTVPLTVSLPDGVTDVSIDCSAGNVRGWADTGPARLDLKPAPYTLDFLATRRLNARFYSKQCYRPAVPIGLYRDRVATNRTFDAATGANTTAAPNGFAAQIFASADAAVSPVDRWTLELPLAENPCFMNVSTSDVAEFDGGELGDAMLSLEFITMP